MIGRQAVVLECTVCLSSTLHRHDLTPDAHAKRFLCRAHATCVAACRTRVSRYRLAGKQTRLGVLLLLAASVLRPTAVVARSCRQVTGVVGLCRLVQIVDGLGARDSHHVHMSQVVTQTANYLSHDVQLCCH